MTWVKGAMRGIRLLERLRAIDQRPDWRGESDRQTTIASVLEHLSKMLNTRQGSVPTAMDLGMPDFTGMAGSLTADILPELEQTLTGVISKYEPRLTEVKVVFEPQPEKSFMLGFKLSAKVRVDDNDVPVVFETVLNSEGHITVMEQ